MKGTHEGQRGQGGTLSQETEHAQLLDYEAGLLGILTVCPALVRAVREGGGSLSPDHFYLKAHRAIYCAILSCLDEGLVPEHPILMEHLRRTGEWHLVETLGGAEYLSSLRHGAYPEIPDNVCWYAGKVTEAYRKRSLRRRLLEATAANNDGQSVGDVLKPLLPKLIALSEDGSGQASGRRGRSLEEVAGSLAAPSWLWPRWVPRGFVTLMAGQSGIGKSALALRLAQSVLAGAPWPDGAPGPEPGPVWWIEAEGCQALLRSRTEAAGMPTRRLFLLCDPSVGGPVDARFPQDWKVLQEEVARVKPALVVVDSLSAFLVGADENRAQDIGDLFRELCGLAKDTGAAILVVHHIRKRGADESDVVNLDRIRGSSMITQWPRSVLAIDKPDPSEDAPLRVVHLKANLGALAPSLGFRIANGGLLTFCEPPRTPGRDVQLEHAKDFLSDALEERPSPAGQVYEEADQAGIAKRTLKRAKQALLVVSVRREGKWWWSLPGQADPDGDEVNPEQDQLPF